MKKSTEATSKSKHAAHEDMRPPRDIEAELAAMDDDDLFKIGVMGARDDLLTFMQFTWPSSEPMKIGRHTVAFCSRLTKAAWDYILHGKSTYAIMNCPPRHGKSDIVSRFFPPWFLGLCHMMGLQPDVLLTSYGADVARGFSNDAKTLMEGDEYKAVFPGVKLSKKINSAEKWKVEGSKGTVNASGLIGSITGKGGDVIVVDD